MMHLLRRSAASLAFVAGFMVTTSAFAQEAPDVLVKRVSGEVLELIKNDKDIQAGNTTRAGELIDSKVAPYFDFKRMTSLAMGREWKNASADQKEALAKEFHILLVRSYSTALTQYKNQTLTFKPMRMQPTDSEVTVRSEAKQPGGKAVSIDYDLEKVNNEWKVYDVAVEGVSLVVNYRDSFSQEIKANGVDGLIKTLHDKNTKSSSSTEAKK